MTTTALPTCYRHPDRETGLSCSECGRPICTECMTPAAVGIRCPDHAGRSRVIKAPRIVARPSGEAVATRALIGINVLVYAITAAQGRGNGSIFERFVLFGPFVDHGDWWRLFTSMFLHYGPLHLALNVLALWWFGAAVDTVLGRGRFLLLYLVSGLAGAAGALVVSPETLTVGASGAIFGILGAAFVLERQRLYVLGGSALSLIVLNLAFTFFIPGISIGGHLGGLFAGALGTFALSRFGTGHAAYGRPGLVGVLGLVAIGVVSVLISYWSVQQYVV